MTLVRQAGGVALLGFFGHFWMGYDDGTERADVVWQAIERADERILFQIDTELVPSWCPRCETHYCLKHWSTWATFDEHFYDATYGRCPQGHQRKLDD